MKVLFTITSLHGGGAEFVARTWAATLASEGHVVEIGVTTRQTSSSDVREWTDLPVRWLGSGLTKQIRNLRRLLSRNHYDAVVSLQTFPNLVSIVAIQTLPSKDRPYHLISERNLVSLGVRGASTSHRLKIAAARRLYNRADHVIAISHPVAAELVSWFGVRGERCSVVPNPATAKPGLPEVVTMRPLNLSEPISIVLPSRLAPQKQPLKAIEAAAELLTRGNRVRVVSFGVGPLLGDVSSRAASLGVEFEHRGWNERWFAHCPENSVVLLPSNREGFGNVLVEAACVGIPAVALSGALGTADAVVPGVTGQLAVSADPAALARSIEDCATLERVEIQGWLRRFTPLASTQLLLELLAPASAERNVAAGGMVARS